MPMTTWPRTVIVQVGHPGLGAAAGGTDLQHDLGGKGILARGGDFGPFFDILGVGVTGRLSGPALDQDFQAGLNQRRDGSRDECDATFAGVILPRDCNNHGASTPMAQLERR